jgi:hypothetical protein
MADYRNDAFGLVGAKNPLLGGAGVGYAPTIDGSRS